MGLSQLFSLLYEVLLDFFWSYFVLAAKFFHLSYGFVIEIYHFLLVLGSLLWGRWRLLLRNYGRIYEWILHLRAKLGLRRNLNRCWHWNLVLHLIWSEMISRDGLVPLRNDDFWLIQEIILLLILHVEVVGQRVIWVNIRLWKAWLNRLIRKLLLGNLGLRRLNGKLILDRGLNRILLHLRGNFLLYLWAINHRLARLLLIPAIHDLLLFI